MNRSLSVAPTPIIRSPPQEQKRRRVWKTCQELCKRRTHSWHWHLARGVADTGWKPVPLANPRKLRTRSWHWHLARGVADTAWKPVPLANPRKLRTHSWHWHLARGVAD